MTVAEPVVDTLWNHHLPPGAKDVEGPDAMLRYLKRI
jgi:hypothetical protein